jgi:predicted regulator of Ras-like GTPase activity (Roadblock/LC7/MglB family)
MTDQNITRQDELIRVMESLADSLSEVYWITLVDREGFILASVPAYPEVSPETIAAMSAALSSTVERILGEIDGGELRYTSVVGSRRHHIMVMLPESRFLTIGLPPNVSPQQTFKPIRQWLPELLTVLKKRYVN